MAVSNWIDHLSAEEVAGAVYPGVGTEGILVLIAFVLWIGWHVLSARQENEKLSKIARKRPSSNAWKSNVTDG
tara:strand:+ start:206 stop:424 length:219 start_codon:yes stop_codon:yes gene_type:complete